MAITITFNEAEQQTLAGALHTACTRYREHLKELPTLKIDHTARVNVADIFERQLRDCQRLLVRVEG